MLTVARLGTLSTVVESVLASWWQQLVARGAATGREVRMAAKHVTADEPARRTLAAKVDHLFTTVHPAGRGDYTFEEVARSLEERGGPTVSATYIWQLRRGIRDNPTKKHLEALAGFFGVPPAYFFDEGASERIESELEFLAALRDSSVRLVALRARGLSPRSIGALRDMIDHLRQLEGLPDEPQAAWPGEEPPEPAEQEAAPPVAAPRRRRAATG